MVGGGSLCKLQYQTERWEAHLGCSLSAGLGQPFLSGLATHNEKCLPHFGLSPTPSFLLPTLQCFPITYYTYHITYFPSDDGKTGEMWDVMIIVMFMLCYACYMDVDVSCADSFYVNISYLCFL